MAVRTPGEPERNKCSLVGMKDSRDSEAAAEISAKDCGCGWLGSGVWVLSCSLETNLDERCEIIPEVWMTISVAALSNSQVELELERSNAGWASVLAGTLWATSLGGIVSSRVRKRLVLETLDCCGCTSRL